MSPNPSEIDKDHLLGPLIEDKPQKAAPRQFVVVYRSVLTFVYFYLAGLYGLYLCFISAKWATLVLAVFLFVAAELGITVAAHRFWSHRSFKAKLPLQIILMVFNTLAWQGTASHWARDHRLHHKYSDTDGDPHNSSRGFFYAYVGWLMTRKSEDIVERGKKINVDDLTSNPVLRFQDKYATPLISMICFILPTVIPAYCWRESLLTAWHVNIFRYLMNLNVSFLANTLSHMYGGRPYGKDMAPSNNLFVHLISLGDGFHNFHHAFPWDYQSSETGNKSFSLATYFIDFFAWIGWAYDLKKASEDVVKKRRERVGDGRGLWG